MKIAGISLIQRVYTICTKVSGSAKAVVATDDRRIKSHVESFGGEVVMTKRSHPSGTDRVAEVAKKFSSEIIINVQGDEPLLKPPVIRKLIELLTRNKKLEMATLGHSISRVEDYDDPNVVKVVTDKNSNALYFSRSSIPHFRNAKPNLKRCFRHIGIYAYRHDFLLQYVRWPQSFLEQSEKLEQLRALENGAKIGVLKTNYEAIGVDVPHDVKRVEALLAR